MIFCNVIFSRPINNKNTTQNIATVIFYYIDSDFGKFLLTLILLAHIAQGGIW
jgi:hypothetical protein